MRSSSACSKIITINYAPFFMFWPPYNITTDSRQHELMLQGTFHVPKHVRRELSMSAKSGLIVYRLHTPLQSIHERLRLEICLSEDALATVVRGKHGWKVR